MTNPLLLTLAALLALSAFLMGSRTRLLSLIRLFRFQALLLGAILLVAAHVFSEPELALMAVILLALKALLIPFVLARIATKTGIGGRLATFVRPTTMAFLATFALVVSAYLASRLPFPGSGFMIAPALALALIGFELLIVHRNLFGQGIGFLVLENGIFFLGFALGHGMPLFIEIGVLFDLLALLVIATALIRRAHTTHRSIATDYLETLKDL